jgi:hypothetical protein
MNANTSEQAQPPGLVELPQSGLVRIHGTAQLVQVFRGPLKAVQAAIPPAVCFPSTGNLKGWVFSRSEIRDEKDGMATLLLFWMAHCSPFLCRPTNTMEVEE